MKTIVIANNKGGVCKTTIAFNLSYILQNYFKKRVIAIDLDHQCDLTDYFIDKNLIKDNMSVVKLFEQKLYKDNIQKIIYKTESNVDILPSEIDLNGQEAVIVADPIHAHQRIKRILNQIDSLYDYAIIDTPPSLNQITQNGFAAADYIILPVELSLVCIKSTTMTLRYIDVISSNSEKPKKILSVLPVKADYRRRIDRDIKESFLQQFSVTEEMLKEEDTSEENDTRLFHMLNDAYNGFEEINYMRETTVFQQANAMKTSIIDFDGKSMHSKYMKNWIKSLLDKME